MKKVFFANHAQFEGKYTNLGDWAIFEQMIKRLEPYVNTKIQIIVPSADVQYTNEHYPVTAIKRGGIQGILNALRWIRKCDIVVIGGGEIVQDRSSLVYIPYQLIRPLIGKIFKKKLFGYAIGVGDREEISAIGRLQARMVLNMFDTITVRDEKSYRILREYLKVKRPSIYLTADPALNLSVDHTDEILNNDKFFVISARSIYHRNHNILPFAIRKKLHLVPKVYYSEIKRFQKDIAMLVEQTIEKYGYNVYFLNTYTGKQMSAGDDGFTKTIIAKIDSKYASKIHVINPEYTPSQIKNHLKDAQFILSVPLHPLILGGAEGVPVLSLAYASKNRCFMEQIEMERFIYKVEVLGDRIDKRQINKDIDDIIFNRNKWSKELVEKVSYLKIQELKNAQLLLQLCDISE